MSHRRLTNPQQNASTAPVPANAPQSRHDQFMASQQAKGLLWPEEEWEERVNRGLRALFGPAPAGRRK